MISAEDAANSVVPHDGARAKVVVREVVTYTVEYNVDPLDYGLAPDDTFTYGELLQVDQRELADGTRSVFDLEEFQGSTNMHVQSTEVLSIGMVAEREDFLRIVGY